MLTAQAFVRARGIDSYPFSLGGTPQTAQAFADDGCDFFTPYLGVISKDRLQMLLDAGIAILPVTLGATENHIDRFNGQIAASEAKALGIPPGCHLILDMESTVHMPSPFLIDKINGFARAVKAEGYRAGMYVGLPQPLTSNELWLLEVDFYWRAPGRMVDRNGQLAEPTGCGWGAYQLWPTVKVGGVDVDHDVIQEDFKGRLPYWAAP